MTGGADNRKQSLADLVSGQYRRLARAARQKREVDNPWRCVAAQRSVELEYHIDMR